MLTTGKADTTDVYEVEKQGKYDCWVNKCLRGKISRGLMAYGEDEYTYKYASFCINIRHILL